MSLSLQVYFRQWLVIKNFNLTNIDWTQSKAYPLKLGTFMNLKNACPQGALTLADSSKGMEQNCLSKQ